MPKYHVTVARKSPLGSVSYRNYDVEAPDVKTAKEIAIGKSQHENPKDQEFVIRDIKER